MISQKIPVSHHPQSVRHGLRQVAMLVVGLLAAPLLHAAVATVFSDDFESGKRPGWFNVSGGGDALSVSKAPGDALSGKSLRANNSNAAGVLHFPAQTLSVGDSLTISFKLSLDSVEDEDGNLRFALLDSSIGTKVSADHNKFDQFAGYQGYRAFTNSGSNVNGRTSLSKRDPSVTTGLTTGSGWSTLAGSNTAGVLLSPGKAYPVTITIERTKPNSLQIAFTMNGVTSKATDNGATNFSFDTFGYSKTKTNGVLYLDDLAVTSTKAR